MMILMQQMKHVFCKRLAACLCMQLSPSVSPEFPIVDITKTNVGSGDRSNNDNDFKTPEDVSATKNESAGEALQENRDLLDLYQFILNPKLYWTQSAVAAALNTLNNREGEGCKNLMSEQASLQVYE